jgi:hypothetical protein
MQADLQTKFGVLPASEVPSSIDQTLERQEQTVLGSGILRIESRAKGD